MEGKYLEQVNTARTARSVAFSHMSFLTYLPRRVLRTCPQTRLIHSSNARLQQGNHFLKHRLCPSCSTPLASYLPACKKCWYISKPSSKATYFEILDIPKDSNQLNLDPKTLKKLFRRAQTACHPDTWAMQGSVSFYTSSPTSLT